MIKYHDYSTEELERFRHFQRLSYGILDSTAGDLRAGISEIEALPTNQTLDEGDTFILDAAPIFDGYTVDTSCAYDFGEDNACRSA